MNNPSKNLGSEANPPHDAGPPCAGPCAGTCAGTHAGSCAGPSQAEIQAPQMLAHPPVKCASQAGLPLNGSVVESFGAVVYAPKCYQSTIL